MPSKNLDDSQELGACPVCDGGIYLWRNRRNGSGTFRIDRCRRCGFAFVNPRPSKQHIESFYRNSGHASRADSAPLDLGELLENEAKYPNSTVDAARIIGQLSTLLGLEGGRSPALLDVGSGYGFLIREALRCGFSATGLEFAQNERAICKELSGVTPIDASFEDYSSTAQEKYRVLVMSQILEHARDINSWLSKSASLLEQEGLLCIALPNFNSVCRLIFGERDPYICPPAHLNFFTLYNLRLLLEKHGFCVVRSECISRIPKYVFEQRLGWISPVLASMSGRISEKIFRQLDRVGIGVMLNVYARNGVRMEARG